MGVKVGKEELATGTYHYPIQHRGSEAYQNVITAYPPIAELPKGSGGLLEVKTYQITRRPDGEEVFRKIRSTIVDIPPRTTRGTSNGRIQGT